MQFKDLDIIEPILEALDKQGYTSPTPIQEQSIPLILDGRDVLGSAQTGTGKTAAFAIPTLQILKREKDLSNTLNEIKCLILTPTRELAIQIEESFNDYGKGLGLRHAVIFGWVSQHAQVSKLKRWVDILVATPGRLLDLIQQWFINLKHIEIFIGWNNVNIIHLNDSKTPLYSKKDRHEELGDGFIGIEGLSAFVKLCLKRNIPIVLETPCVTSTHAEQIKKLLLE